MKNLLTTLFFLCGLSATQLLAQNCPPCPPCPPGCCILTCETHGPACKMDKQAMATATSGNAMQCTPEQLAACKEACKAAKGSMASNEKEGGAPAAMNVSLVNNTAQKATSPCCATKCASDKAAKPAAMVAKQ